ncbi:hypothetical protein LY44_03083, partial [Rhodobacter capsulatus]
PEGIVTSACRSAVAARQTVKLTTLIIGTRPRVRYALGPQSLARPNRPHISSDSINVKEQGNKNNRQHQSLGASSQYHLQFSVCFQSLALPSASFRNHRRFGEGSSTDTHQPPQPPFSKITKISRRARQTPSIHWAKSNTQKRTPKHARNFVAQRRQRKTENSCTRPGDTGESQGKRPALPARPRPSHAKARHGAGRARRVSARTGHILRA